MLLEFFFLLLYFTIFLLSLSLSFSHKGTLKMLKGLFCLKWIMCLQDELHIYSLVLRVGAGTPTPQ